MTRKEFMQPVIEEAVKDFFLWSQYGQTWLDKKFKELFND
jgi:hypothetical protein